jgi:murein DD-endopeptidase MepM/ murein hydrolase activator NlpD
MAYRNRRKSSAPRRFLLILLMALITIGTVCSYILFFEGEKPAASLDKTNNYIGLNSTIQYAATDRKSGIKSITVYGTQGNMKKLLHTVTFPRSSFIGQAGPSEQSQSISFNTKKHGFKEGQLTITLEAVDFSLRGWLKGNKTIVLKEITIDTKPPRIEILHNEKYIIPGGAGIAIYRLSDSDTRHGVEVNGYFNPGFPVGDGRDDTFISFFALPFDAEKIDSLKITALDKAGNSAIFPFSTTYKADRKKKDKINISDGFLNRKIPEFQQYYQEMSGSLVEKYLYINNTVRKQNNQKISELCKNPREERSWKGRFLRMAGSSRAGFADYRTYYFDGKTIDNQTHLGMDIASTRRVDVKAANNGYVVFADYLGIYGNMVMIDHGQGVFSLYSHLSQINVAVEDKVDQQTILGLTGTTGMAGGDHLHFSMLVNGVFVTPKEWWDQHWIDVTIEEPITDSKF